MLFTLNKTNNNRLDTSKVGLYVISFNSPSQFETLIKSMLDYDSDFITKTKKFLLDNSTDLSNVKSFNTFNTDCNKLLCLSLKAIDSL